MGWAGIFFYLMARIDSGTDVAPIFDAKTYLRRGR